MPDEESKGRGRALYEELKARILDGTFAEGSVLVSTRACAAERGLSRTTVTLVYEQLHAEGYIRSSAGAPSRVAIGLRQSKARAGGTLAVGKPALKRTPSLSAYGRNVAALACQPVAPETPGLIDFSYGPLAADDFPTLRWSKVARRVEVTRGERLAYIEPLGDLGLRKELQSYLSRARGIACDVEQLMVASGSQQVLDMCARLLVDAGDTVVVENPGYKMAHRVFQAVGAELKGVEVDEYGLVTLRLPRDGARLAYVTPTHQFPLGSFLTMPRRLELLAWARAAGSWLVEDDYDGEYRYSIRPEESLYSLDSDGRVVYVGTFSKTLSPQLRMGYAVLPMSLVEAFSKAKQLMDRHAAIAPQRVLGALLSEGSYDRHVRRIRRVQLSRRAALLSALEEHLGEKVEVQGAASGLHLVVWVKGLKPADELRVVQAAFSVGVRVNALSPLYLLQVANQASPRPAGLVLGYSLLDVPKIEMGIKRLAAVIKQLDR